MYAKISLISAIMKLKKSLDDCGIGEVKNPETLSNSLKNTLITKRLNDLKRI